MANRKQKAPQTFDREYHSIYFSFWLLTILCLITISFRSYVQLHTRISTTFFKNEKIITTVTTTLTKSPWQTVNVKRNDNIISIFKRANVNSSDYHKVLQQPEAKETLRKIQPNHPLYLLLSKKDHHLLKLVYKINHLHYFEIIKIKNEFKSKTIKQMLELKIQTSSLKIQHSLNHAANRAGFSNQFIQQLTKIFSWKINFKKALRAGDTLRVVYQQYYANNKKAKIGEILAAELINHKHNYVAIRYTDKHNHAGYFNPNGKSLKRAFMRFPLRYKRISSHFNSKRVHPILKIVRRHEGVDLAAARGTPIKAASDGTIIFRSRKGGYGKAIIIKHGKHYTTLYAHMSHYAKDIHLNSYVKYGQVIGYVGTTGLATGPHLHYEFRVDGVHRNPETIKLPNAQSIPQNERVAFNRQVTKMMAILNNTKKQ